MTKLTDTAMHKTDEIDPLANAAYELAMFQTITSDLRAIRKQLGMTQAELARRANLSQPQISLLEKGTGGSPRLSTLLAVCRALDVTIGAKPVTSH